MATLKAIRRRIASVRSTEQITRAMKLISAARLRRAQEALLSARPYDEALKRVADSVLLTVPELIAPAENAAGRILIVVVTSDRGLAGGYNINLLRLADQEALHRRSRGLESEFFAIGRKALDHLRRTKQSLAGERINNLPRLATVGLAREIGQLVLAQWRSGAIGEAGLVYNVFRSAVSQRPTYEKLLPIEPPGESGAARPPASDYLVEPSPAELVPVVLRRYVETAILHALLEAEASEHGARMTAMDAATNNAVEMIDRLTLDMNRARQAAITKELMDIVGGAEAVRG
ncbi:MAG: ATP synthase F1 subunit gamma [Deltaproteobacteria bacterium]|nr:ATP synthase F1 subunit gamma [Deltaproteobacteria bacterium]